MSDLLSRTLPIPPTHALLTSTHRHRPSSPYTGWLPPRRSTLDPKSTEDSNAPRRGLANGATQQLPGRARAGTRLGSSVRSFVQEAPGGRTPVVLSSPCPRRCPVRASGVPRVAVQPIGVRCPVRVSERPGVQCPASGVRCASGVGAFQRPLCPAGMRSCSVAVGQAGAGLGWSAAWSPAVSTTARRLPRGQGPGVLSIRPDCPVATHDS
jgi:hypothetical protein